MTYPSEILADSPLVYWRLGEPSGTSAADASGNSNTGTYIGSPTLGGSGYLTGDADTAVTFTGAVNQRVETTGTPVAIGTLATFACECIFNVPASGIATLCSLSDPAGIANDLISLIYASGYVSFDFQGTGGYSPSAIAAATGVHHLVGEFNGTEVRLYVDGALADTQSFTDAGAVQTVANAFAAAGYPGGGTNAAVGKLDEPAFYTHALGPTRVAAHYAAMVGAGTTTNISLNVTQTQTPTLSAIFTAALGDYGFIVGGTTFGADTILLDLPGFEGLGIPDAKTQDVTWALRDGAYANPDYTQMRVITIPIIIRAATEAAAMTSLTSVETAFANSAVNTTLQMSLPGWGVFSVSGRPRGVQADLTLARNGVVRALARFDCPDPTIAFAP